jgi:methylmalonyl-CoA mutase
VVCLVGHDKAYAEWGAELATALREAGAQWVILAGKPVDGITTDDTCAMGVDALDFLRRTREKLA